MAITLEDLKGENAFKSAEEINQPPVEQTPEVETPVEETPQEAPTEEPVAEEPKVEEPKAEEPKEEPKVEEAGSQQFDFAAFNEKIGRNYESLDDVKADLDKPTMESEYNETKEALDKVQAELDELAKLNEQLVQQTDPYSYFSDDNALKASVFKKQYPKKDVGIIEKVFATEDLSSIDDLEMVKMGWKFNSSKSLGTDAKIEAAIKEELNADPDAPLSELSDTAQVRLAKMANEYRGAFDQMRQDVKLPERVNLEELKSQIKESEESRLKTLTEGWSGIAESALKETTKIQVPIGEPKEGEEQRFFDWDLGAPPQEDVDRLKENYIQMGLDPTGDAADLFQESLNLSLISKHLPQIMQKYEDDIVARKEKERLDETHNPEPLKDSERAERSAKEKEKEEQTSFAIGGLGAAFQGNPLFTIKK